MSNHFKFGVYTGEIDKEYFYNNTWCIEKYPNYESVTVAPKENQIEFMLDVLKNFEPPYWCLYVLLVSREDNEAGRYQCPYPMSYEEIYEFALKYKDYFETDGRHHIWMGSAKTKQLLVYDQHNVIYIYDDILKTSKYLKDKGFLEENIQFPVPHSHMYNVENDSFEIDIFKRWEWIKFPLGEQDVR
jgi:hypothetical protein